MSDEQRALIEPLVTAWQQARSATGGPGSCALREAVNALTPSSSAKLSAGPTSRWLHPAVAPGRSGPASA